MNNKTKIFTLEDSQERIDWIKSNFNFADIDITIAQPLRRKGNGRSFN